ncbi:MAG: DUF427 domain-containing protein [Marmoricola sp.]|nr:DUF427 domain-containing protein [Marmoricola sp.]
MPRLKLQPSAKHPITVEQSSETVTVSLDGRPIATTNRALVLREASYPPVYYVPQEDIESDVLAPSDTQSYCPFKGDASYFDVSLTADSVREAPIVSDAGWTYRDPYDAVAEIANHVAFYPDKVDIQVA